MYNWQLSRRICLQGIIIIIIIIIPCTGISHSQGRYLNRAHKEEDKHIYIYPLFELTSALF
jgi:hypothetical protein